jgi:competence protein ComEC
MLERLQKYALPILVFGLFLVVSYIFYLDVRSSNAQLTFAMLDIGQGDAIYIESPTGTEVMFDGGPPHAVLSPLAKVMPFFDKSIDALVITNPDADHISGFLDILKNYKVKAVLEPGTFNSSKIYLDIKNEIKKQNIRDIVAKKGMRLDLGGGAVIDILFPDRDVTDWATNDGSIVARLSYGNTSIMLTGDAPSKTEELVLKNNSIKNLASDILKVGHHGSRSATSSQFVKVVSPKYALISLGKNNKYGHPHKETLNTLAAQGVKVLRTDLLGSIIMHSNGKTVTFSFEN